MFVSLTTNRCRNVESIRVYVNGFAKKFINHVRGPIYFRAASKSSSGIMMMNRLVNLRRRTAWINSRPEKKPIVST